MTEKDLKKLFEEKLGGMDHEFNPSNWEAFEQMADPAEPLSEQEFKNLFEDKLSEVSFEFNEKNWEAFEQMTDPQEPLSEQEYKKLFRDKLAKATFPFNPDNWEAMEDELGPEKGMSGQEMQSLFQKKTSESNFAFNPENWSRMEAILDQRSRKPFAFFWRSAAAILVSAGLAIAMLWQQDLTSGKLVLPENEISEELISPEANDQGPLNPSMKSSEQGSSQSPDAIATNVAAMSEQSAPLNTGGQNQTSNNQDLLASESAEALNYKALNIPPRGIDDAALFFGPSSNGLRPLFFESEDAGPAQDLAHYVPQTYTHLNMLAGPALSTALNGKMGTPGWQIGLELEYGWNDKASLSLGLIYNRSGDIGLETLQDSTFFGLGRTEVQTHRHYKNLSSLRLPLNYRYKLNSKHSFGVGLNTDLLLRVTMDQTKTTQVFKQDPQVEHSAFNQKMDSFESLNFSAAFSYRFQFSERLSVALSYALPLNDISRDNIQGFEANHRPAQTNLQLRYRLFGE